MGEKRVIFNTAKNRKYYEQYRPDDDLEKWMLENNNDRIAIDYPTHVSQRGGYYNIENTFEFVKIWKTTIEKGKEFFIEEIRGSLFRLYLDIDVKLTKKEKFNLVGSGWLKDIQKFVGSTFSTDSDCILTDSHGEWADSTTKSAVFKSGFRLYFVNIFVDSPTFTDFIPKLVKFMHEEHGSYSHQPKDWGIDNIIDTEILTHNRARLFGSTKFRRGNFLGRVYNFSGLYQNGEINDKSTKNLKSNLFELLQLTLVNIDNTKSEFFTEYKVTSFSNKKSQSLTLLLHHLGANDFDWHPQ